MLLTEAASAGNLLAHLSCYLCSEKVHNPLPFGRGLALLTKDAQQETCLRILPATLSFKRCINPSPCGEGFVLLTKDAQQETCSDGGADNASHVGAHGVHQQEVGGVVLLAYGVGNTGSHGNSGNTGGAD